MCGIAGVLGLEDAQLVRQMADRLAHRGPDGEGVWTDAGVSLAHRRLAIVDVAHGQQPMASQDGRHVIVYNGEVYNHAHIREKLDVAWRTTSDTETVLEAFRAWGPDAVTKFEGMFAFAVWDTQTRQVFVARDPFGIKPFFHAFVEGAWVFASEQKALFAHPGLKPVADLDRIKERAALEFLTGQATLFKGVRQLPPGTWAVLEPGAQRIEWQPYCGVPVEHFAHPEDAAKAIRERFEQSVEEQLMSDVPLGVILSGGLDSTAVAAVHARIADQPIDTFTIAESEEVEDFQRARELAEHLGTNHHETFFDLDDVWRDLPRYTWHNENINYTEFFFLPLFEHMRKTVTVGLCGQGSDELWGGYDRYKDPLPLGRERIARIRAAAPEHAEELAELVNHTHTHGATLAEWDQHGQLNNFQLRLVDRNSMATSLEVRVPFLSKPQQAASRASPWGWKIHAETEKWVLRKALEDANIPHDLLWRRKVPAGRATGPGVMARFEEEAERLVGKKMGKHSLAGTFGKPAECLLYDLWNEVFIERDGWKGVTLEQFA